MYKYLKRSNFILTAWCCSFLENLRSLLPFSSTLNELKPHSVYDSAQSLYLLSPVFGSRVLCLSLQEGIAV